MKKILIIITLMCMGKVSFSQANDKMDYYLASKLKSYSAKKADANLMLPMLIKGNIGAIKQLVKRSGGFFKYSYGNIAAIAIPASALSAFNESGYVTRMEGAPHHIRPCNDTMRLRNSIVAVQQGLSPLPQAYNGKGVVMGFIDTGIDYLHPDFIDSNGKSRVKYYWDMNQPNGIYTPMPYGYGQAWNQAEIDAGLANNSSSSIDYGHGSNVAGAATSNARANGQEKGGAPKCDIIMVAYNFNTQTATEMTDAVNYIYKMADSLNEPCIINASLGDYSGSHDGHDMQALMIDSMILAKQPGRIFVAAAGNAGGISFHLHDSLTSSLDTACTWFRYDAGNGNVDIPLFADTADLNKINFAIAVDKVNTGSYIQRAITPFSNIKAHLGQVDSVDVKNTQGNIIGKIVYYAQTYYPGTYSMEYVITTDSTNYYWRLITAGKGRFDGWAFSSGGSTDIVDTTGLGLSQAKYPEMKKYKQPDSNQTLCSSFQCSPQVITVADYYNRKCWKDSRFRDTCHSGILPGELATNSSCGPTRNYVLYKPDIGGAGSAMMSSLPTTLKAGYISGSPNVIDSGGWHNIDGGTSLASPGVASVAALYLERYPTANYYEVWYAITHCDSIDAYTGPVPNYKFGYGKVNAFKALTGCAPTGVSDITPPDNATMLKAYPNPAAAGVTIEYSFLDVKSYNKAQVVFYDMLGKEIKFIPLNNNYGSVSVGKSLLPSGMYFYSLIVDGSRLKTEKLEVL